MQLLKQLFWYFLWTLLAVLLGLCHMYLVVAPATSFSSSFWQWVSDMMVYHALLYVGVPVGILIALIFILFDSFYLKSRLKNNLRGVVIRLVVLLMITVGIGGIHYFLEKVVDVI